MKNKITIILLTLIVSYGNAIGQDSSRYVKLLDEKKIGVGL